MLRNLEMSVVDAVVLRLCSVASLVYIHIVIKHVVVVLYAVQIALVIPTALLMSGPAMVREKNSGIIPAISLVARAGIQ
jgi:hypothetical protein